MKALNGVWILLAVCFLAFAACKKSGQGVGSNTDYNGVTVDWPKLDTHFANGDPEAKTAAYQAKRNISYGRLPDALADLEKLAGNPNLTDAQKKVVAELTEQTKQAIAKAPPPPK
jgi:hypothetical protein